MEYNYGHLGNQTLQNMLPIFGSLANGSANTSPYLSQLMAALQGGSSAKTPAANSQAASTTTTATANTTHYGRKRRSKTPEPPPAPRFSSFSENRNKTRANQGAQPMDLEKEGDLDTSNIDSNQTSGKGKTTQVGLQKQTTTPTTATTTDSSLLLNAILSGGVNPSAANYMFFPTATGSMLMDPMMAAALQQLHGYNSYLPTGAESAVGVPTEATSETATASSYGDQPMKELIKTKHCTLFPPAPHALAPTIRERPPGCRTVFVGGLPELATEEIIREIFDSCGDITTLRMSKKNFCHIRFRNESSVDRAIYLSGYRVRISTTNDPANFGRLHVDYAQARDDQYDYECKQRQLQREQRHRDRTSLDHRRSQSPPPTPHYSDHEASLVSECLRNNESFIKAVQTISVWLERGDCSKKNANMFYSMIQSTHAHVRRLHTDKQQLEQDLKKARECYRKQMLAMSQQFTQIEKVFNAASHKKVWDHFSKAQRKNIDQWKKLAAELRSVQIEDDEMEMSDEDRDVSKGGHAKRSRYDNDHLKYENDSLRCQVEAMRSELSLERTDTKYNSDFREKQIKVLQETIRNMQTQLMLIKSKEQKDQKIIEQLERKLKESGVKQLLLKTKIRETTEKLKEREGSLETSEAVVEQSAATETAADDKKKEEESKKAASVADESNAELAKKSAPEPEAIDLDNIQDDVVIVENECDVVEIADCDDVQIIDSEKEKQQTTEEKPAAQSKETAALKPTLENEIKSVADAEEEHKKQLKLLAEARIIALVTAFLVVHPLGVSCDNICNYLCDIIKPCQLDAMALANILNKYTNIFQATPNKQEKSTSDVIIKWKFCGYKTESSDESQKEA